MKLPISRISLIKVLSIILDEKLSFTNHIDYVINEGMKMLGFVKRQTSEFKSEKTIIMLYNSLVKSKLMYFTPILVSWDVGRIKTVQHKFFSYIAFKFKLPIPSFTHVYNEIAIFTELYHLFAPFNNSTTSYTYTKLWPDKLNARNYTILNYNYTLG